MAEPKLKEKADTITAQQKELVAQYQACAGKRYKLNGDESGRYEIVAVYAGVKQFADQSLYHTFQVHHYRPDGGSDAITCPACKLFLESHTEITQ